MKTRYIAKRMPYTKHDFSIYDTKKHIDLITTSLSQVEAQHIAKKLNKLLKRKSK